MTDMACNVVTFYKRIYPLEDNGSCKSCIFLQNEPSVQPCLLCLDRFVFHGDDGIYVEWTPYYGVTK